LLFRETGCIGYAREHHKSTRDSAVRVESRHGPEGSLSDHF